MVKKSFQAFLSIAAIVRGRRDRRDDDLVARRAETLRIFFIGIELGPDALFGLVGEWRRGGRVEVLG